MKQSSARSRSERSPAYEFRALIALMLAVVSVGTRNVQAQTAARPNVITIVTDDQAMWSLGAYGNKECQTPSMDRIAREGAKFTNAFVTTPVCSPSRACFLTGMQGTQLGITDWINNLEASSGVGLPPQAVTWPEVLKANGYTTALVGKWHLGDKPQFHPTKHGFDHFFGFIGGGQFPMDPWLEKDGKTQQFKGPISDLLTDDAIAFVEASKDKPFALHLTYREPHQPYVPMPEQDASIYKDLDAKIPRTRTKEDAELIKRWTRDYYASIHAADRNIGRLLAKLDELKLSGNTIVLFTSDHGYMIGQHSLHTKGNAAFIGGGIEGPRRPNMFEESIRVPLLIRWPAVIKPGSEIDYDVTNADTFATILGMTNLPAPAESKQTGVDFSPLLRGQSLPPREAIFGQYDLHNGGLAYMRMIRTPKWKLVRHHFANGLSELYDLASDPHETKNLYNETSARATRQELQAKLTAWQKSIDDPILRDGRKLKSEETLENAKAN